MRKIARGRAAEEGRALARLGDGGWDPLLAGRAARGALDDELVGGRRRGACARGGAPVAWVAAVPSRAQRRRSSPDFAHRLAAALGAAVRAGARARRRPPAAARDDQLRRSRSPTCAARSRSSGAVPPARCLLVDDVRFSGWTLAMVAGQLRRKGSGAVYPLALSTAF